MVVMTTWRRLVSLGRKLCLFVCYVKHVANKQWVAKGVASVEWRGEIKCCRMNIRRGVQRQRKRSMVLVASVVDCVESRAYKDR
jgi:hypothetical protein